MASGCRSEVGRFLAIRHSIPGMTCGHCVEAVRMALESVDGTDVATVDLTAAVAVVRGTAKARELIDVVEASGFEASIAAKSTKVKAMGTVVTGMGCDACEKLVEVFVLRNVPAATSVRAARELSQVTVKGGPQLSLAAIEKAVHLAGFATAPKKPKVVDRLKQLEGGFSPASASGPKKPHFFATAVPPQPPGSPLSEPGTGRASSGMKVPPIKVISFEKSPQNAPNDDSVVKELGWLEKRRPPPLQFLDDDENEWQEIRVSGMSCTACAARVERALEKSKAPLQDITVNCLTDVARFRRPKGDDSATSEAVAAIKSAGYGAMVSFTPASSHRGTPLNSPWISPTSTDAADKKLAVVDLLVSDLHGCEVAWKRLERALQARRGKVLKNIEVLPDDDEDLCCIDKITGAEYPSARLWVEYDTTAVGARQIQKCCEQLDFDAAVELDEATEQLTSREKAKRLARVAEMRSYAMQAGIAFVLGIPIMLVMMFILPYGSQDTKRALKTNLLRGWTPSYRYMALEGGMSWLLATPIQFAPYLGLRFYGGAFKALRQGSANMDVLVALGTSAAYFYSVYVVLSQLGNRPCCRLHHTRTCHAHSSHDGGHDGGHHSGGSDHSHEEDEDDDHDGPRCFVGHHFFETSSLLIAFVLLGKVLEARAKGKTSQAIQALLSLQPPTATVVGDETVLVDVEPFEDVDVDASTLRRGDVVKILPGDKVPADSVVIRGDSSVDESHLTGESMPVNKHPLGDDLDKSFFPSGPGQQRRTMDSEISEARSSFQDKDDTSEMNAASKLFGGSVCVGPGALFARVTAVGAESLLAGIVRLVEEAQGSKTKIEAIADVVSRYFVFFVAIIASAAFVLWYVLALTEAIPRSFYRDEGKFLFAFLFAVATLVVACPCALGLATPTAVMVGTGLGATHGVLIKGGRALEVARSVDTVVFDKTGTLTLGKPSVVDVIVFDANTQFTTSVSALAHILAIVESHSEHPLARAIVDFGQAFLPSGVHDDDEIVLTIDDNDDETGVVMNRLSKTSEKWGLVAADALVGRGISAEIETEGETFVFHVGNRALMAELGGFADDTQRHHIEKAINPFEKKGNTVVFVHISEPVVSEDDDEKPFRITGDRTESKGEVTGSIVAAIAIADVVRPEAADAVARLLQRGLNVYMLSGDAPRPAQAIAAAIGMPPDRVIAKVLPHEKARHLRNLQSKGHVVAMVGDGVNDSPALASADLGVAMGGGASIAVEAADVVLVRSRLYDVLVAIEISVATFARIRINLFCSLVFNSLGIPIAAGILYPWTRTRLPPEVAAIAMTCSSIAVVTSSLALRRFTPPTASVSVPSPITEEHKDSSEDL